MRTQSLFLVICCGLALLFASCDALGPPSLVFQPLEFPLDNAGDIARIAAFGIRNWSGTEPHNGIDLVIKESLASARIISPYYGRFGFSAEKAGALWMPGPYQRHRLLALELAPGALDGARGLISATGTRAPAPDLAALVRATAGAPMAHAA